MKKYGALPLSFLALAGLVAPLPAAEPESSNARWDTPADIANGRLPMDLARGSVGARVQVRAPKSRGNENDDQENRSAQALISDDAALGYPLVSGVTSVLVTLPKIEVLSRFNFISYEAGGDVSIAASSVKLPFESPDWRTIAKEHQFNSQEVVGCPLGSIEARYLKFDFNTRTPGRIASLGLFGLPKISNFKVQPMSFNYAAAGGVGRLESRSVFFDYANLYTGANVVAVSRGGTIDQAQAMIDGNPETSYAFDAADPAPTMVVDLGVRRQLNRVSCVFQAGPGTFDVYLADNPGDSAGLQRVALNFTGTPQEDSAVASLGIGARKRTALMSVDTATQPGIGRASADVAGLTGRFLIAEFHPAAQEPDFKDFKDFKDGPTTGDPGRNAYPAAATPFRVLAFSAFGAPPHDQVITRLPVTPINPNTPPSPDLFPPTPLGTNVVSP